MRAYDLALIVARVSGAVQLVQAGVSLFFCIIRIVNGLVAAQHLVAARHFMIATELSRITFPMEEAAGGVAILLLSRPIARFGSKLATKLNKFSSESASSA